jgi:hypothetical protein
MITVELPEHVVERAKFCAELKNRESTVGPWEVKDAIGVALSLFQESIEKRLKSREEADNG